MTTIVFSVSLFIEVIILVVIAHYVVRARAGSTGVEFRYISRVSLRSYSTLALSLAAVCAAGLWALLPVTFELWDYGEAPLPVRLSASALIVGALGSAAFILAIYRAYELGKTPGKPEVEQRVRLGNLQFVFLLCLAFIALSGVAQGALFLLAALWGWSA